ncbi:hypothetical protein CULT_480023 [[Clostridium] ultunense Esp]|nr:hypothetical protein CULT_480023 [[Clostridium] ultunense Esp]
MEHVILLDSLNVPTRLEELSLLKDGWFDGEGKALDKNGIKWFADLFTRFYPDELPLPYVFPTIEGDIRLEWSMGPYEASLELVELFLVGVLLRAPFFCNNSNTSAIIIKENSSIGDEWVRVSTMSGT